MTNLIVWYQSNPIVCNSVVLLAKLIKISSEGIYYVWSMCGQRWCFRYPGMPFPAWGFPSRCSDFYDILWHFMAVKLWMWATTMIVIPTLLTQGHVSIHRIATMLHDSFLVRPAPGQAWGAPAAKNPAAAVKTSRLILANSWWWGFGRG